MTQASLYLEFEFAQDFPPFGRRALSGSEGEKGCSRRRLQQQEVFPSLAYCIDSRRSISIARFVYSTSRGSCVCVFVCVSAKSLAMNSNAAPAGAPPLHSNLNAGAVPVHLQYPVHTKVYKHFVGHGWFWGTVTSYSSANHHYRIHYTDGDQEDVLHATLTPLVLAAKAQLSQSQSQSPQPTTPTRPPAPALTAAAAAPSSFSSLVSRITGIFNPTLIPITMARAKIMSKMEEVIDVDATVDATSTATAASDVIDVDIDVDIDLIDASSSNEDVDEDYVQGADDDNDNGARRSKRQRVSTLVYMDGHAVKKDNNYVLKGGSYKFGVVSKQDNEQDQTKKQKQKIKAASRKNRKLAPGTVVAAPRVLSQVQADRLVMKERVSKNKLDKAAARAAFLQRCSATLAPFLEQKVLDKISTSTSSATAAGDKEQTVYMQPDSITADMRDYQLQGLNWMANMHRQNMGMILGDGMYYILSVLVYRTVSYRTTCETTCMDTCVCRGSEVTCFLTTFFLFFCHRNGLGKDAADHFTHLSLEGNVPRIGSQRCPLPLVGPLLLVCRNQKVESFFEISSVSFLQSGISCQPK